MTGGQVSPTTPMGDFATTAPYGGMENTFDIAGLTVAAGASYVARSTVYHAKALERMIEQAIRKKGFSLVEIMSPCPTAYGKINKKGLPKEIRNLRLSMLRKPRQCHRKISAAGSLPVSWRIANCLIISVQMIKLCLRHKEDKRKPSHELSL